MDLRTSATDPVISREWKPEMKGLDGFVACDSVPEPGKPKGRWSRLINDFLESGNAVMFREYSTSDEASHAANCLRNPCKASNTRRYATETCLREETGVNSFEFAVVEIHKRDKTIFLERREVEVRRQEDWDGKMRFPRFGWM